MENWLKQFNYNLVIYLKFEYFNIYLNKSFNIIMSKQKISYLYALY